MKREEERIVARMLKSLTDEQLSQRVAIAMEDFDRTADIIKLLFRIKGKVPFEKIAEFIDFKRGREVLDLYCAYFDEAGRRFSLTPA